MTKSELAKRLEAEVKAMGDTIIIDYKISDINGTSTWHMLDPEENEEGRRNRLTKEGAKRLFGHLLETDMDRSLTEKLKDFRSSLSHNLQQGKTYYDYNTRVRRT